MDDADSHPPTTASCRSSASDSVARRQTSQHAVGRIKRAETVPQRLAVERLAGHTRMQMAIVRGRRSAAPPSDSRYGRGGRWRYWLHTVRILKTQAYRVVNDGLIHRVITEPRPRAPCWRSLRDPRRPPPCLRAVSSLRRPRAHRAPLISRPRGRRYQRGSSPRPPTAFSAGPPAGGRRHTRRLSQGTDCPRSRRR